MYKGDYFKRRYDPNSFFFGTIPVYICLSFIDICVIGLIFVSLFPQYNRTFTLTY